VLVQCRQQGPGFSPLDPATWLSRHGLSLCVCRVSALQVITRTASQRIAEFAFKYAEEHGRKTVCAVHKATIMCVTGRCYRVTSGGCAS